MVTVPRLVIAAPGSGHGKTSVATGLIGALRERGMKVSPHKVGPDYIDPGYHALAAGRAGRNLDPWLVGEDQIAPMFAWGARTPEPADIAVIEGVMGLFDGVAHERDFASTAHVARLLSAPVVLVVDAHGAGASAAALLHGFTTWDPGTRIAGVIFNKAGSPRHEELLREAADAAGVPVLGVLRRRDRLTVPSRHLGLIPAAELGGQAADAVAALTRMVAASVDLEAVLRLARGAGPLPGSADQDQDQSLATERLRHPFPRPRIAIAGGPAFTFGYAEHPELLTAAGAEVVTFDPLRDEKLPGDVDGLVIGGGFPEEHAADLSANASLRARVAALARSGGPVIAECAGLLYLARSLDGHPMCGVLDAEAVMTGRLTLGYRDAVAAAASPLAAAGTRVHGHEFHRTAIETGASRDRGGAACAWHWRQSGAAVTEGFVEGRVHASYLHTHWAGIPGAAARITAAASEFRRARVSGQALALDGWADGDVADFNVVRLFDGEGDGPGDRLRRDGELVPAAADLLAGFRVVDGVGEFRADEAGRYRRRAQHAVGRFLPQAFQQGADRVLGRGIDRLGRDDLQSRGGHRSHEVSMALPAKHRERGRDAVEHTPEVDVDHRRPAVDVEVGHRPDLADAGVADQHVEPAELLDGPAYQALEVRAAGDVGGAGDGSPAVVADLLRELVQSVGAARAKGDDGAALREHARGGLADAAARPGDGDDLAVDAGHGEPPRVKWTRVRLSPSVPDTCPLS
jgi:cobyrinic acid a,c-diamide synthase